MDIGLAIGGVFFLLTAALPSKPGQYFGERLFGVKLIPYSVLDPICLILGGFCIGAAVK